VRPARAALALVTDGVDEGGPLGARVEVGGEGGHVDVGRDVVGAGNVAGADGLDAEHALGLEQRHAYKALVDAGSPRGLHGVNLVDLGLGDDGQEVTVHNGDGGGYREEGGDDNGRAEHDCDGYVSDRLRSRT